MGLRAVLFITAISALAAPADGATLRIASGSDNTLFESSTGDISNGAGEFIFAGLTGRDGRRRGLLRFDLESAGLPAGAILTGATLRLHMSRTISAGEEVALHRVLRAWGEGASDAELEEGGGAAAAPGDATWLSAFFPGDAWTTPGGDFDPVPRAVTVVVGDGFYEWTSSEVLQDVQGWLAQPASNHGWLLHGNEEVSGSAKRFDSFQNANAAVRPELLITYVPEPAGAGALLTLALLPRRRA